MRLRPGAAGMAPYLLTFDRNHNDLLLAQHGKARLARLPLGQGMPGALLVAGNWLVLAEITRSRCRIVSLADGKERARIGFGQRDGIGFSFHDERLLVFDRARRLVDLDCATGLASTLCLS